MNNAAFSLTSIFDDWQNNELKKIQRNGSFIGRFLGSSQLKPYRVLTSSEGRIVIVIAYTSLLSTFAGIFREELLRASFAIKRHQNKEACFQKHS